MSSTSSRRNTTLRSSDCLVPLTNSTPISQELTEKLLVTFSLQTDFEANESILVLACATGALILEIAQAYGGIHGRIVGVDPTMAAIVLARQKLFNMNLLGDKEFFCGNPYDMNGLYQVLKAEAVSSGPLRKFKAPINKFP